MNVREAAHRSDSLAPGHVLILLEVHVFPYLRQCTRLSYSLNGTRYFLNGVINKEMIEPCSIDEPDGVPFKLTERGRVYLESLMRVRLPTKKWVLNDE